MSWLIWGVVALVIFAIWTEHKEKKRDPEGYARRKAERDKRYAKEKKAAAVREYQEANKRVPASQWMRMNKYEKADVLERREKAAEDLKKS